MDYLFFKPANSKLITDSVVELCNDQVVNIENEYLTAQRPSTYSYLDRENERGVFISGKIKYKDLTVVDSLKILMEDILSDRWPLTNDYDGMFSGLVFSKDKVIVFNDPIGLWHLYYSFTDDYIAVTTNLNSIKKLTNASMRMSALVLEATGGEFCQYGTSTILENVHTLFPGEMKVFEDGKSYSLFDTTIKVEDKVAPKDFANELVKFINEKSRKFYSEDDKFIASVSGGIDSRVNIAALGVEDFDYHFVNYGKPEFIDSKIPMKIAKKLGKPIEIIDSVDMQFPRKELVGLAVKETDSLFINSWFSVLHNKKINKNYPSFLLGDMCDILRSKGISSIKSRSFRRNFYIQKFIFNRNLKLTAINSTEIENFKNNKLSIILRNSEKAMNYLKIDTKDREIIRSEINNDINELFEHLNKYNSETIESYEELFGVFTHGRRSMGKQLNILKYKFVPYIPLLNLQIIRKVLNYSPISRYSDELTNKMFKHHTWQFLGKFPTNQNPFIAYNSLYYLMLLGWFLRSSIDQLLIKTHIRTKGKFKRQRLFKSVDIHATYSYPGNFDNFKSSFDDDVDAKELIELYEGRLNKTKWPLSGMDLIPYIQTSMYLKYYK